ncbi:response regulator [Brevibacillus fulvus]|uniref:Transcriptional regulatory protein n=1 Tax=Brevibacillus fulvus TaxID=1125967 RepID=A0A939BUG8_9BACL|nr:response regulator [Brevibacillus fulvus]MBM7590449.1 two-component system CitB family response regulator [Brevibacillus fulvus]
MSTIDVLIVEDDRRIIEINQKFIEKLEGFSVIALATNGEQAKELLAYTKPQLVLLDVYLPDMLGIELVWHIRQHYRDIDIIMITAAREIEMVYEALRGGVFDYIVKPLIFESFQERMESYRNHLKRRDRGSGIVDQAEIDLLLTRGQPQNKPKETVMPKGIDSLTLEKVIQAVSQAREAGVTAEEVGKLIGTSRTTARRYLEFLVTEGRIRADLVYGTVGRPERKYLGQL